MPEGDTLHRTAAGLRPYLLGRVVQAAVARQPGPRVERVVGSTIQAVEALGKNLLIRFDNGLELRTHLRMHGSWHRYAPGERWRRPPSRARLVLEVPGCVAVCFDAPVVELFEQRTEALHPSLGAIGPDLVSPAFDGAEALRRLREPVRADMTIGEALLDQRALAGIGNVYRSEVLWIERVDPFTRVGRLDHETLVRIIETARRLLVENADPAHGPARTTTGTGSRAGAGLRLWVYRRAGRPCRRCGTGIRAARHGSDVPRTVYWCPRCQGSDVMATIDVEATVQEPGWSCRVTVADGSGTTEHRVRVRPEDLERFGAPGEDAASLVRRSFAFLLEREPKESILRSFDLPVIARYFPEYPSRIRPSGAGGSAAPGQEHG